MHSSLSLCVQVLSVIGSAKSDHGLHVNEVMSMVKNQGYSEGSIK